MKLSKAKMKAHEEAEALIASGRPLTNDEQYFILENWHPGARHMSGKTAAFFTPQGLAYELAVQCYGVGRCVDLGAGIGRLSRALIDADCNHDISEVICIELNPDYLAAGQKVVPEARWILGSFLDEEIWAELCDLDFAISNPPFGNVMAKGSEWKGYKGPGEMLAMAVALDVTREGATAILPQMSCPFKCSGCRKEHHNPQVYARFKKAYPDADFSWSSVDTSVYKDEWVDVSPRVELVNVRRGE